MVERASESGVTARDAGRRCIAVRAAGGLYGFDLEHVQEIVAVTPLTRVFHAPSALAGVASLRGDVLPVLDLGELLARRSTPRGLETARFVVVRAGSFEARAGLLVEALVGLRDLPDGALAEPPATLPEVTRRFVYGVVSEPPPCAMVDVEVVLRAPELDAHAAGNEA